MSLLIAQIIRSLILIPNLGVFSSEPLSHSGSSDWEEWKCTAYSTCCIFPVGKRKGSLLDTVWCVGGGGGGTKPAYFSPFLQIKDIHEFKNLHVNLPVSICPDHPFKLFICNQFLLRQSQ